MQPYYLYKIVNTVNHKIYIGVTKHPSRRWSGHIHKSSKCPKLRNAIKKYGKDKFSMQILCIGEKEYILDLEEKLIKSYNSVEDGYNIHRGGLLFSSEHFLKNTSKLEPVYAKGFWFPSREHALNSLNITDDVFRRMKRQGLLTKLGWEDNIKPSTKHVYVLGFWFRSVDIASDVLNISRTSAWRYSKLPDGGLVKFKNKEPARVANSKPVEVYGVRYDSIKDACKATGIPKRTFYRRLKANHPDFKLI